MKCINSTSFIRAHNSATINFNMSKLLKHQLSELEIIDLSNKFLTQGIHSFKVESLDDGRACIKTILKSLNYYKDIAYLSTFETNEAIPNIYSLLKKDGWLEKANHLSEFFCENFYFDFLWIEASQDLLASEWFEIFEMNLLDFQLDRVMPIMILSE